MSETTLELRQIQQRFRRRDIRPFTPRSMQAGAKWLERYINRRAGENGIVRQPIHVELDTDPSRREHSLCFWTAYAYLPGRKGEIIQLPDEAPNSA